VTVETFHERRRAIREELGGRDRVDAVRAAGRLTVRERIDALLDPGSFSELGTFARSARPEDATSTPGDGKVGGFGTINGRPVVVAGDDITVKRASSSLVGGRKLRRLFQAALDAGVPMVFFGETGGARIPDMMGSAGFAEIGPLAYPFDRRRRVPLVTVIVGESYGGSSFYAATSDLVVQVRGSCLAVSSARVIAAATGERITAEELGGVDVHARRTGQIDVVAETEREACELVRRFLSYLPSNHTQPPPRSAAAEADPRAECVGELVPANRRRAYDMRRLVRALVDRDTFLELKPAFAPSLLTGLARIGGLACGVIASQPMHQAGVLTPDACDKAVRLICLCDAFSLPLVFLHDTPGFMIGRHVEHDRLLAKSMMLKQAVTMSSSPKVSVIVRKSFGLANHAMCGVGMGADLLCAWPGAEISFMDPEAAASVVAPSGRRDGDAVERVARDVRPYGAAGLMHVDEIIDPADTREVIRSALERAAAAPRDHRGTRALASWPMSW
jgi:acetyl-CoA carboxylase carboxyltransferase component